MNHGFSTLDLASNLSTTRRIEVANAFQAAPRSGGRVRAAVGRMLVSAGFRLLGPSADRPVGPMSLRGT